MINTTLGEVCAVVGGALVNGRDDHGITGVFIDSRQVITGGLFIAIAGARTDGHGFVADTLAAGAAATLSTREVPGPHIIVPDTVIALGRLAAWYRSTLSATVVAITGSSGKTTTKDLVAAILEAQGATVSAVGSLNTEVGVPLTILSADLNTAFLVLEMGMRGRGHIAMLVEMAQPDIAVIVNAGSAHIELLGSTDAIVAAKAEILGTLGAAGWAILNGDDPRMWELPTQGHRMFFGESARCQVRAENIALDSTACASFELVHEGVSALVKMQLHGEHYVMNALAAASVGIVTGMSIGAIAERLSQAIPRSPWRMAVTRTAAGITVINDSYNANPESMRAALKSLAAMKGDGRTWAVLGEMRELGEHSVREHDAIGRLAVRLDIDNLVCIGPETKVMHLGATNEGSWADESRWFAGADEAMIFLRDAVQPGDVVLVKASRSVGLERVAQSLVEEPA